MNKSFYTKLKLIKYLYLLLFIGVCGYLLYFNFFEARAIAANSYNRRLRSENTHVIRGSIIDRGGHIVVSSTKLKNSVKRKYLYGGYFSHIIGYSSKNLGSSGLEAFYNKDLMTPGNTIEAIKSKASGAYIEGSDIRLTLDKDLQAYASDLLGSRKGAIVVLKPDTGEILAMVSKPDFNPSDIQENWNTLIEDTDSPLLNRATDGLYPPGSIFKVVTAASMIKNDFENETIDCTGKINVEGYEIKDAGEKKHGIISLSDAFRFSCNAYFIGQSLHLGMENLFAEAVRFKFNKPIPSDIKIAQSAFPKKSGDKSIAQQAIGQGDALITPMHGAVIAAAIANKGMMMQPYAVSAVEDAQGHDIKTFKPKQIGQIIETDTAELLKRMMVDVVKSGTGTKAKISKVETAGKTGTAENAKGKDHAWFIGFAPADRPQVAIAVLIEHGGSGGSTAAPIAGKVMKKALSILK